MSTAEEDIEIPETSAFGTRMGKEPDLFDQETESEETPETEEAPAPEPDAADEAEIPSGVHDGDEAAPEAPETGEQSEEEAVELIAGQFKTVEELERAYRESRELFDRQGQQKNAAERQAMDLAARYAQLEAAARQLLESQAPPAAQPPPEPTDDQLASLGMDRDGYRQLQPLIQQQVQAAVQPLNQELQKARAEQSTLAQRIEAERLADQQSQVYAESQGTIEAFRAAHPEYVHGSAEDASLAQTIQAWNAQWSGDPSGVDAQGNPLAGSFDIADAGSLEIAHEARIRPALADVLRFHPDYFDSESGMELARRQASILEASTDNRSKPRKAPASPHVESGASGAPPQSPEGTTPDDPIREIFDYAAKSKNRSAFFT